MITHILVGTSNPEGARAFYDAALGALGFPKSQMPEGAPRHFYGAFGKGTVFGVGTPGNGEAATAANGGTIGFGAPDVAAVDAFHAAGLANGGTCEGAPGPRPNAPGKSYGAYLRDPDGNKICAFCQMPD
jgi:catechol 2,3-dioxygenase-like lactoylglutathione lyase family enzyme